MKLIIPIRYYVKGGVERVIIALISNLVDQVDQIVIVANDKDIQYFKPLLPNSEKLSYELWNWSPSDLQNKLLAGLNKLLSISQKLKLQPLAKVVNQKLKTLRLDERLNYLIEKYQITHCLYIYINRLKPPTLTVPLCGIAYDVFWRFAPLTYPEDYVKNFDQSLLTWLQKSDLICTISQKTCDDIISIFPAPQYAAKVHAVPLAGFSSHDTKENTPTREVKENPSMIFYFPSSFGIYKDHLTLLKAGLKLAEKNRDFQIVLIGKETDDFINGKLSLSKQSKTQEYEQYLQECNKVYQENKELIGKHFKGLGFCDYETVEYYYEACSCVVVPSQFEGFGLAISEAIVRGLPVIASDLEVFKEQATVYQCSERIDFFTKGDADALAACLEQFIQHPKEKLSSTEAAEKFAHWTWQDVARKYVTLMQEIQC